MSILSLLFSFHGRISRGDFWYAVLLVLSVFIVLNVALTNAFNRSVAFVLYLPLYWSLAALCIKRYHDIGRSGFWLLLLILPILGPLWVFGSLALRKGQQFENRFGPLSPRPELDYFTVAHQSLVINDVTNLNPVSVTKIVRPTSVEELAKIITTSSGPLSVGGGYFSMGGQTACTGGLHIDMRSLNKVLTFSPAERWIRVQAGIRWCDLQRFLDPHDFSVKIMQTYANFTVGGSLSVNSHGRYVGLGPLVLSVRSITLLLLDGKIVTATPATNSDLFYASIGGYGALGIIVEAELEIADNSRVTCMTKRLPVKDYLAYFRAEVRDNPRAVFHNADLYPPQYMRTNSQTWVETKLPVTQTSRLMHLRSNFPLERYVYWAISETPFGTWRREFIYDPLFFFRRQVHWRNYEAGYDVASLEPRSRAKNTYVLQEYFVPVGRFEEFVPKMAEILNKHRVNMLNISIRHARPDAGTIMAWAREEVFAFVLYYKQGVDAAAMEAVGIWTRELIDAALACGGTYYLPYQPHATDSQFHRAYPRAAELFAMKRRYDPAFRLRNSLWIKYYAPTLEKMP